MSKILEMIDITKTYDNGVAANKNVNFTVNEGEIHALMGENGAGKSTLMKVLFGIENKDSGKIFYRGKEADISSPSKALSLGIGMVSQHFMLIDSLKVYENVFLGMMDDSKIFTKKQYYIDQVKKYCEKFNFNIDPLAVTGDVSVSVKQKIEILKVLVRGSSLIILDEPTAVLTPQETNELFKQFLLLKEQGYTIIFISHKINEVLDICDRATILKDGRSITTVDLKKIKAEDLSKLMVGRNISRIVKKDKIDSNQEILKVMNLSLICDGVQKLKNINFNIKSGEILGVAGVDGNGQNELANAIMGLLKVSNGKIIVKGKNIVNFNVKRRRDLGVSMIPEDRMTLGIAKDMTIMDNLMSDKIDKDIFKGRIGLSYKNIEDYSNSLRKNFSIKSTSVNENVGNLSGGNVQKVVVARELSSNPDILIANQPSRGVDIGAKHFIWDQIIDFRDKKKSVLLISADLNEILELSDKIIVMLNGEIVGYFEECKNITEDMLGLYMLGVKRDKFYENF